MMIRTFGKPLRVTRRCTSNSTSISTKFSYNLRNASTASGKAKKRKRPTTGNLSRPTAVDHLLSESSTQAWTIVPRVGYWNAKLRTPISPEIIVLTISLAISSIIATSLAFPDPSSISTPSETSGEGENTPTTKPTKSILDFLFLPVKFIFRPLLVDEKAQEEAKQTWKYWIGCAAGLSSLTLFAASHFFRPRHVRLLSISPAQAMSSATSSSPTNSGGILRIQPAFGRTVTHPIRETVLVSPLFLQNDKRSVLTTTRINGPRGALRGWGVNMFKDGAVVNGKPCSQRDVISLMERIWVLHGGQIDVGR